MNATNSDALCDRCKLRITRRDGSLDYTVYRVMRMDHGIKEMTLNILCAECSLGVAAAMEPVPA